MYVCMHPGEPTNSPAPICFSLDRFPRKPFVNLYRKDVTLAQALRSLRESTQFIRLGCACVCSILPRKRVLFFLSLLISFLFPLRASVKDALTARHGGEWREWRAREGKGEGGEGLVMALARQKLLPRGTLASILEVFSFFLWCGKPNTSSLSVQQATGTSFPTGSGHQQAGGRRRRRRKVRRRRRVLSDIVCTGMRVDIHSSIRAAKSET